MTTKEINKYRDRVAAFIVGRQLRNAFGELKAMVSRMNAWPLADRLEKAEESYAFMLKYMVAGAADPERDQVYSDIVSNLYDVLDQVVFSLLKKEENTQYFSLVRFHEAAHKSSDRLVALIDSMAEAVDDSSLFSLLSSGGADASVQRQKLERTKSDLFSAIWTTPKLSLAEASALRDALESDALGEGVKTHLLSAMLLAEFQIHDPRRLELMMGAYMRGANLRVRAVALVAMLLSLWRWRERPLSKKETNMLAAVKDTPQWCADLQTATIELIRAYDTARLNKKISDEVIPEMMNLRPEIMDKINNGAIDPSDMASMQENPEWQELLDKNGISDKLKEISEEQMEGGDVMMSTFSHLKTFPFFNDISNWFLPFTSSHTQVEQSCAKLGVVGEMVENATFFCDSDKYSFVLALERVPQAQRDMMTSQFKSQRDAIYQAMGDMAADTAPMAMRRAVNLYLQNIYRFFKLYRRKEEFMDPFAHGANLVSVPALASDFSDEGILKVVAEFYFKYGYMADSLKVFERLEELSAGDAPRYQKMGYAYEKKRSYANAISYYEKAELLDSSTWTLRRLAACYRAIGEKDKAVEYYSLLADREPDNLKTQMLLGYSLIERDEPERALKHFYKVEFLDEKSHKAWRPIAWSLFLSGNFEGALKYYRKILGENPTESDLLNMGHVQLASGNVADAVESYRRSALLRGGDPASIVDAIMQDVSHLKAAGVDVAQLPLVVDAVMYSLKG